MNLATRADHRNRKGQGILIHDAIFKNLGKRLSLTAGRLRVLCNRKHSDIQKGNQNDGHRIVGRLAGAFQDGILRRTTGRLEESAYRRTGGRCGTKVDAWDPSRARGSLAILSDLLGTSKGGRTVVQDGCRFCRKTNGRLPIKWGDCPLYPRRVVSTGGRNRPFRLEDSEFFERINANFTWKRSGSYNSWT